MLLLSKLRKTKNCTQLQLAEYLGISRQAYANYESGKREPDYATLSKLADYFNVSTDYLLGRTTKGSPIPIITKQEIELIKKYRDNPKMQPAVNTLLGITTEEPEDVYEIPVAARSGKSGKTTSSFSEDERRAALESEFPGVFEETE